MFQDCSLNHKTTLKEFWHSLKCFEEGKALTSSFDDLADRDNDKEEGVVFEELPGSLGPSEQPSHVWSDLISFLWSGRVRMPAHSRHLRMCFHMSYLTFIPSNQPSSWHILHIHWINTFRFNWTDAANWRWQIAFYLQARLLYSFRSSEDVLFLLELQ